MNEVTFFFLTGNFLTLVLKTGLGIMLALAIYRYYRQGDYARLIPWSIVFYLGFALAATVILYYVWSGSEFTKNFLVMPLEQATAFGIGKYFYGLFSGHHGYFLFTILDLYWLPAIYSIAAAAVVYWLLAYRGQNQSLGFLAALAAGWPAVLIFLVLTAVIAAALALYRKLFLQQELTSLDQPLLAAAALTFLFSDLLLGLF